MKATGNPMARFGYIICIRANKIAPDKIINIFFLKINFNLCIKNTEKINCCKKDKGINSNKVRKIKALVKFASIWKIILTTKRKIRANTENPV